jgi:hypothetical protein
MTIENVKMNQQTHLNQNMASINKVNREIHFMEI